MAFLIRFKVVEIDSKISFNGTTTKTLKYTVRSLSLVPLHKAPCKERKCGEIPEIFWQ
jgi:hypothetical protein